MSIITYEMVTFQNTRSANKRAAQVGSPVTTRARDLVGWSRTTAPPASGRHRLLLLVVVVVVGWGVGVGCAGWAPLGGLRVRWVGGPSDTLVAMARGLTVMQSLVLPPSGLEL